MTIKRRELLTGLAAASLVAGVPIRSAAAAADDEEKVVEFLFVQNARGVSLKDGSLTLKGVAPETLYFSDRPDRIVGRITTKEYVDRWAVRENWVMLAEQRASLAAETPAEEAEPSPSDTPEGDGNMLDRTLVLWGSAHPHASHSTKNYPIQIAGGNKLGFRHGMLHAFEGAQKVPLANLFVSMLNAVDVPAQKFADSTGVMSELRS